MTKAIAFAVFVGVMLSIFQQITGINAILYYGAEIFSSALGYGAEEALKQQLWLGAVNLAFTFVAMSIAVAAQWLFNGIVANTFPLVNQSDLNADVFNGGLPYFIFVAFCVVACVFVWRLVPETKRPIARSAGTTLGQKALE